MSPWGSAAFSGAREVQALRIEPTLHPQRWSLEGPAPAGGGAVALRSPGQWPWPALACRR